MSVARELRMANKVRGAWVAVAIVLLASGVAVDRWAEDRGATCDGSGNACPGAALVKLVKGNGPAPVVRAEGSPRLLVFSSSDCPACARMKPVLAAIERNCGAAKDITHVDVDVDPGEGLAASYGVTLLPTVVSVDARGREVARLTGVQTARSLERALEEVRGAKCASTQPSPAATAM
jgi:thiol-disulfide isomerase/thioredoxin